MSQSSTESTNRRPEYVTLIAVYQFITAAVLFLLSCMIPALVFPMIFSYMDGTEEIFFAMTLVTAVLAMVVGFGFASIVVGYGLLRMRNWGRLGAIVLAAFALIGFPIWTIVAVLVLVYLTSDEARNAFIQKTGSAATPESSPSPETRAVYKAEPAPKPDYHPLQDTRPMAATSAAAPTRQESPAPIPPDDETHRIDPIPMPVSREPDATPDIPIEEEPFGPGDIQEPTREIPLGQPSGDQPTVETPTVTPVNSAGAPPKQRRWVLPPEEAGMDSRILRPREEDADPRDQKG